MTEDNAFFPSTFTQKEPLWNGMPQRKITLPLYHYYTNESRTPERIISLLSPLFGYHCHVKNNSWRARCPGIPQQNTRVSVIISKIFRGNPLNEDDVLRTANPAASFDILSTTDDKPVILHHHWHQLSHVDFEILPVLDIIKIHLKNWVI